MENRFERNLMSEINLKDQLSGEWTCAIGSNSWQFECRGGEDGIVGASYNQELFQLFTQKNKRTLDGEAISIPIGGKVLNLVVFKSIITTADRMTLKTSASLFEFGVKDLRQINVPMTAIIPIDNGVKPPDFSRYFGNWVPEADRLVCSVVSPRHNCTLNGIRFCFRGKPFLVYVHFGGAKSGQSQIVVESEEAFTYVEFCECVRRILCVIGFFTGTYYYGSFWINNAQSHDFIAYNHCMSKGGSAKYHMWSLNPFEYFAGADIANMKPESAREVEKELRPITKGQFEKLLGLLDDKDFAHLFYMFHEISLKMSHLTASARFPVYAACLEACREWWARTNPPKLMLYTKDERLKIVSEMEKLLMTHYPDCSDTKYFIEKKVRNQSIFRMGNMDAIKDALQGVGMNLTDEEIAALKWRNNVLHGTDIITSEFNIDCPTTYIDEMEHKLLTLHALIWRFIMRAIGYEGFYIDIEKRNNLFRKSESNGGSPVMKSVKSMKYTYAYKTSDGVRHEDT